MELQMLVLTTHKNGSFTIFKDDEPICEVTLLAIKGSQVLHGIAADNDIVIKRNELIKEGEKIKNGFDDKRRRHNGRYEPRTR